MLYLVSLAVGVLAGSLYALLGVRSPAPPIVALVGLLGMLLGEQLVPIARRIASGQPLSASWFVSECAPHITGAPGARPPASTDMIARSTSAGARGKQ
jgi:XapX domain-containing protein